MTKERFDFEALCNRIPVVSDSSILEYMSDIEVSREQIQYRQRRGFFQRVLDGILGKDAKHRLLFDQNMLHGQQLLFTLINEITERARVSDLALKHTQSSLLEARQAIRLGFGNIKQNESSIQALERSLENFSSVVEERLSNLEREVGRLSVMDNLQSSVTAWRSGRTFSGLPWFIQLHLLCFQVFTSVLIEDLLRGEVTREMTSRLGDQIMLGLQERQAPKTVHVFEELEALQSSLDEDDLEMSLALLDPRKLKRQEIPQRTIHFLLGTTLELVEVPEHLSPRTTTQLAFKLLQQNGGQLHRNQELRLFVDRVIKESLDTVIAHSEDIYRKLKS